MYAVIAAGGKQYRVAEGDTLTVERTGTEAGGEINLTPVLVVDGVTVVSDAGALAGATVLGRVTGSVAGPKVTGFTYKSKSNIRRRWGHRQRYDEVEIIGISLGGGQKRKSSASGTKATGNTDGKADGGTDGETDGKDEE
jgi:large subunit ribosomal protein L21